MTNNYRSYSAAARCHLVEANAEWRPFRADDRVAVARSQGCALGYRMTPRCGYARRMQSGPDGVNAGPNSATRNAP